MFCDQWFSQSGRLIGLAERAAPSSTIVGLARQPHRHLVFVLVRFGLLALAAALLFLTGLRVLPVTLDLGRFYAGESVASLAVLLGVAVYAFKVSLAGKPALGRVLEV